MPMLVGWGDVRDWGFGGSSEVITAIIRGQWRPDVMHFYVFRLFFIVELKFKR